MATLLKKFVDADQWEAEDLVGRLGMVLHAAFLFAGFQPYGAQPASGHLLKQAGDVPGSLCLSRWYTAPELACHKNAEAAVLMLCAQGRDVALLMYLTTDVDLESVYRERLDLATVSPLLSRRLPNTEPWGSRLCKSLADAVCWGLLAELCRKNGLPQSSFMSLPDDLKAVILKKLTDGKDLAMVECVSAQLRLLVADRETEMWKPMYEALGLRRRWRTHWWHLWVLSDPESSDEEVLSWKDKYVEARPRPWFRIRSPWFFGSFDAIPRIRCTDFSYAPDWFWLQDPPEKETVSTRDGFSKMPRKVKRKDYKKKPHGTGAIHSLSSRYRWKHR